MVTFNWTISAVERTVSQESLENVIKTVHWRYRGTDENDVTAETYGATAIGDPNPVDFTPFDEVTESDVIGWLEDIMSIAPEVVEGEEAQPSQLEAIQANIEAQIDLLVAPTTITGPLYSAPIEEEVEAVEVVSGSSDISGSI